ncbi:LOW QUALITY PROTEIN: hypothetical protein V2J09_022363 [Rumex salicifolius]
MEEKQIQIEGSDSLLGKKRPQRVKVQQCSKKRKEMSALYLSQDFQAHEGPILVMKFSPDGEFLASAREDRIMRVVVDERSNDIDIPDTDPLSLYFTLNHQLELQPFYAKKERTCKVKRCNRTSDLACVVLPPKVFKLLEKTLCEFKGHRGEILDLSWTNSNDIVTVVSYRSDGQGVKYQHPAFNSRESKLPMGKQKQLSISRFFAPKSADSHPPPPPNPPTPPHKISAVVEFSPHKRARSSELLSSSPLNPSKKPKHPPHTQNPIPSFPQSDPTLHEKFLQKLLEPPDHLLEPSIKNPTPIFQNPKYTPLEQQVVELKERYPDVVLMIEVGYKYRFFGKDAEIVARVLGLYAHVDHNFLTASVPTFRLNVHVRRLVGEGFKVGVVKQTESASIKAHGSNRVGPFGRGLSALYTRATIEAAEDLGGVGGEEGCGSFSNYLFCVLESDNGDSHVKIGAVAVEISTGDVIYGEFNDDFMRSGLEAMLLSLSPAELLLGEPLSKPTAKLLLAYAGPASNVRVERASYDSTKDDGSLVELMALFEDTGEDVPEKQNVDCKVQHAVATEEKPIMAIPGLASQALALTYRHLKQFGLERIILGGASFRPFSSRMKMSLSANALQQLEVLRNHSDGSETGSLLQTMNQTSTIFGLRMLKHWVTHPLCNRNMIIARLDAVTEIAESMGGSKSSDLLKGTKSGTEVVRPELQFILSSVLTTLGRSTDIQRGITRIFHRTATPSEFIAVVEAILFAGKQLLQFCDGSDDVEGRVIVQSSLLRKLIQTASSPTVISSAAKLLSSLNTEAALKGDMLNLIIVSDDQFLEVGEARAQVGLVNEKLSSLIQSYRKQLGMRNLEFLCVSGTTHLIELPSEARVPPSWVKVNSTKKTVRYHPPEVLTALDKLSLENEKLTLVCRAAWNSFLGEFAEHYPEFRACVQALAALDCLHSLAILSRNKNYIRPVFVDDTEPNQIQITSGRHPVLESMLQDNFVPNDTSLSADREYCQIVTGPNMGGKSCYIRQVALTVIMAQVGSFVPARTAKLHVVDEVHTRMGGSDNIQQGRSTFMEELSEASHIIHKCTSKSLVIMDELGRGTSTHDGVAIAYATLHYLLKQKRCMLLFVTHYPKIADIRKQFPGSVGTYHVSYMTSKRKATEEGRYGKEAEDVTYLYKLIPGISERSFGFKVAQLAQLPESCVERATVMAAKLEKLVQWRKEGKSRNESVGRDREDRFKGVCCVFFRFLESALGDDDEETCFRYLKEARNAAGKLG